MPVADEEFPWGHKAETPDPVVVPIRDDQPPSWMDDAPPYFEEAPKDDGDLPGVVDPGTWDGKKAPFREFIIDGWVVRGAAGLLSGQEGVGKSLLAQQMATCGAVGRNFLGLEIAQVKSIYITCEDPLDELWRRQEAINAALGITMAGLAGKLLLVSLKGHIGNELGTFDQAGRLSVAMRYRQIHKVVTEFGAELTFLDNAAHLFPGNENARHDVAAFLGLLERLAEETNGAVILLAHPNKAHAQGSKQGNEFSGSTGWSAHVRSRLFLDWKDEGEDGTPTDPDARILRKSKANYGKKGEEIDFRWHQWAFSRLDDLPDGAGAALAATLQATFENEVFLNCLAVRSQQKRAVSEQEASPTYAPRIFAKMDTAKGLKVDGFKRAMDRLFRISAIERGTLPWDKSRGHPAEGLKMTADYIAKNPGNSASDPCVSHASDRAPDMRPTGFAQDSTTCAPLRPTHTPSTTYIGEASEASPFMYDGGQSDPPEWLDEAPPRTDDDWRDNPILNPNN